MKIKKFLLLCAVYSFVYLFGSAPASNNPDQPLPTSSSSSSSQAAHDASMPQAASLPRDEKRGKEAKETHDVKMGAEDPSRIKVAPLTYEYIAKRFSIDFSPDGRFAIIAYRNLSHSYIDLFSVNQATGVFKFLFSKNLGQGEKPAVAVFSPNGKFLVTNNEHGIQIFEFDRKNLSLNTIHQENDYPIQYDLVDICFSPNGHFIITVGAKALKMWRFEENTGKLISMKQPLLNKQQYARFSPDGSLLATYERGDPEPISRGAIYPAPRFNIFSVNEHGVLTHLITMSKNRGGTDIAFFSNHLFITAQGNELTEGDRIEVYDIAHLEKNHTLKSVFNFTLDTHQRLTYISVTLSHSGNFAAVYQRATAFERYGNTPSFIITDEPTPTSQIFLYKIEKNGGFTLLSTVPIQGEAVVMNKPRPHEGIVAFSPDDSLLVALSEESIHDRTSDLFLNIFEFDNVKGTLTPITGKPLLQHRKRAEEAQKANIFGATKVSGIEQILSEYIGAAEPKEEAVDPEILRALEKTAQEKKRKKTDFDSLIKAIPEVRPNNAQATLNAYLTPFTVNEREPKSGQTPLLSALTQPHPNQAQTVAKIILNYKGHQQMSVEQFKVVDADVTIADNNGDTPFKIALARGFIDVANIIAHAPSMPLQALNKELTPQVLDVFEKIEKPFGNTSAYKALKKRVQEAIKSTTRVKRKEDTQEDQGPVKKQRREEMHEEKKEAEPVAMKLDEPTPLMVAAANDDTQTIETLIQAKASLDAQDKDGNTALMIAIKNNKFDNALILAMPMNAQARSRLNSNGESALDLLYFNNEFWTKTTNKRTELLDLLKQSYSMPSKQ